MELLRRLDLTLLLFLNGLGPQGLRREALIRLTASGLMYLPAAVVA